MKKSSRRLIIKQLLFLALFPLAALASDADPNQLFAFKKVFLEEPKDNVDGTFRAPVLESYKEVFSRNPRFELVDGAAAADAILKTTLTKKTTGTDLEISLVLNGTGEIFSTDKSTIPAGAIGAEMGNAVKALVKTTLKRIPFYGTITGRDDKELTFDIGAAHGLKKGDLIQISRVDNIKRHPLLKTVVDVQLVPVGTAVVDEVEDTIAFGKVYNEIAGEKIQKLYKVTAIEGHVAEADPISPKTNDDEMSSSNEVKYHQSVKTDENPEGRPQLGYVGLGLFLGSFSSSTSLGNGLRNASGSAFSPGVQLNGEIWLTKRWFADLSFGATMFTYDQKEASATMSSLPSGSSSSTRSFSLDFGYKYLPTGSIYGPHAFIKLGYHNFNWDVPTIAADLQTSKTYSALNLGIGGILPVSAEVTGLMLNFNVLLFPGLTEGAQNFTGANPSASGVNFFIGAYHHFTPNIAIRGGFQFAVYSADFDDGASNTSQKSIGFLPSLLYYF